MSEEMHWFPVSYRELLFSENHLSLQLAVGVWTGVESPGLCKDKIFSPEKGHGLYFILFGLE